MSFPSAEQWSGREKAAGHARPTKGAKVAVELMEQALISSSLSGADRSWWCLLMMAVFGISETGRHLSPLRWDRGKWNFQRGKPISRQWSSPNRLQTMPRYPLSGYEGLDRARLLSSLAPRRCIGGPPWPHCHPHLANPPRHGPAWLNAAKL